VVQNKTPGRTTTYFDSKFPSRSFLNTATTDRVRTRTKFLKNMTQELLCTTVLSEYCIVLYLHLLLDIAGRTQPFTI